MTKHLTLCLETSTTNCSVGLLENDHLIALKEINQGYSHAEMLAPLVDEVIRDSGIEKSNLTAVAIGKGPGSYTGLRIGTAFAKGICYALGFPLIAINSLEIMVSQVRSQLNLPDNALLIPMLDARRMEVYTALYDVEGREIKTTHAEVLDSDSFKDRDGQKYCFGPGAHKFFESNFSNRDFEFIEDVVPGVSGMIELIPVSIARKDFVNLAYFEPFYLKDFFAGKPKQLL